MKTILYIVYSYTIEQKRQSIIAVLGVSFGISMFIVMINFMTGVNDFLVSSAFEGTADLRVYGNTGKNNITTNDKSENDELLIYSNTKNFTSKELKKPNEIISFLTVQGGIYGYSPQVTTQVIFTDGENQLSGSISGVDIQKENYIYDLNSRIIAGNLNDLEYQKNGIIIGKNLAQKLNVRVGDFIDIITVNGKTTKMRISAIFSFGISIIDNAKAYVNINYLRTILTLPSNYITEIDIKMNNHYNFEELSNDLLKYFSVNIENWQQSNKTIITGIEVRNTLTWVVSFAMLIVAGFGIYNIMNISVINKIKDISILKAIGFNSNDIIFIFLIQSVLIGIIGSIVGIALGYFLCLGISKLPLDAGDFITIKTYPMNFNVVYYTLGAIFGIITTVLAGYLPARKASKIDPIVTLRGL